MVGFCPTFAVFLQQASSLDLSPSVQLVEIHCTMDFDRRSSLFLQVQPLRLKSAYKSCRYVGMRRYSFHSPPVLSFVQDIQLERVTSSMTTPDLIWLPGLSAEVPCERQYFLSLIFVGGLKSL